MEYFLGFQVALRGNRSISATRGFQDCAKSFITCRNILPLILVEDIWALPVWREKRFGEERRKVFITDN